MVQRVLITDKVHPLLIDGFEKRGFEVVYNTDLTLAELPSILPDFDGIVINSKIIMDARMIDVGRRLQFIARLGSGMEIIDRTYAESKGIRVVNSPEGNRDAVAEHAIGMLLMLANKLRKGDREVRDFVWQREENRGFELKGKTLGIIGLGNTGSRIAKKLSCWELNIIYYDKYLKNTAENSPSFQAVSLEDILSRSDIITLHIPLTDETFHLVDEGFINRCQDGVVLINTSRGKVVDTAALVKGLKSGKIGGACLDVFENEKPASYSSAEEKLYEDLFSMDNIVVSPHVAGWTNESLEKISLFILAKLFPEAV